MKGKGNANPLQPTLWVKGGSYERSLYPTLLHEIAHWSEVRVGWDREKETYAMGELIAEIASCYLAAELNIPNGEPLDNHAAYLKSWLEDNAR